MQILFYFIIIIPSVIVHEVAHGLAALWLGDDTAKRAGRLTLNPVPHIDLFGTVLMPVFLLLISKGSFIFAYAKPVPYNPYNLKSEKDEVKVALAGPLSNLIIAFIFGLLARLVVVVPSLTNMTSFFVSVVGVNVMLAVFNLVPIPPLDGSKLLYFFIPKENIQLRSFLNRYGMLIILFFVFFGFSLLRPVIAFITNLFLGLYF